MTESRFCRIEPRSDASAASSRTEIVHICLRTRSGQGRQHTSLLCCPQSTNPSHLPGNIAASAEDWSEAPIHSSWCNTFVSSEPEGPICLSSTLSCPRPPKHTPEQLLRTKKLYARPLSEGIGKPYPSPGLSLMSSAGCFWPAANKENVPRCTRPRIAADPLHCFGRCLSGCLKTSPPAHIHVIPDQCLKYWLRVNHKYHSAFTQMRHNC